MKQLFLLIIVLFLLQLSESEGQSLPITHYSPDSELTPLPSAEVHQVYQDQLGYIWLAIYSSGLVRYDGVNMDVYNIKDGLRELTVWDLIEGPSGRLWVSSNGGLVVTEEPLSSYTVGNRIKFTSHIAGVPLINVSVNHNRMTVDQDNWLWVGTETLGVVRYRFDQRGGLETDTLRMNPAGFGENIPVRSIAARKNGSVWVSLLDGDILVFEAGKQTGAFNTGSLSNTNALHESPDGTLWGGEKDGRIWRLEEKESGPEFIEINKSLKSNIADISTTSDGTIWVSSEGGGIQKINSERDKTTSYTRASGLLSEIVYNVFEDREKNIWIAQSGGVSKLRYNFKAYKNITATSLTGELPLLPSPSVNSVLPSKVTNNPCSLWAGTSEGGISCITENFESQHIKQQDGLTSNWVNGLIYDTSGNLWIGTSRGINSISFDNNLLVSGAADVNEINLFNKDVLLSTYPMASVLSVTKLMMPERLESKKKIHSIWFPAYHEVYVLVGNTFYTLDNSWGLPAAIYHAAAFDDEGYLWVGTRDRGIYRSVEPLTLTLLQKKSAANESAELFESWWSTDNGAPTNQIDQLLWHEGKMWVGTSLGLLAISGLTKNVIQNITTDNGLLANNAIGIALSPITNTFWIGTNMGLAEVDPESGKVLQTVTKADGLVDNEVWFYGSVHVDADGTVYFGTAKGISIYEPSKDRKNDIPPVVKLTEVTFQDVSGEPNEFTFEYTALSFGNERQVRYQTRLIGFNDEWSVKKADTRINYTNLSAYFLPKSYIFEVRAVNESGVWSEENLAYTFSVAPVWWLQWWAFLGYAFILGVGVFAVDRIQRSRLIKKEREAALLRETELKAEAAIARSKTAEAQAKALASENELKATELEKARELEKAYHELKSTQNRLIQAEKMASLGRLSTGIAHEIKNPLNFINNFAELSKDLVDELHTAIEEGDREEIVLISNNLRFNTQKIEEHGKRADAIVRSMMQHARKGDQNLEVVNLNSIVKQHIDLAYHGKTVNETNFEVTILTELDANMPSMKMISQQLGQVLQNIIDNALDSVWEHKLKSNGRFQPEIKIGTEYKNQNVNIYIADNGPGIPEDIRERIFEPFFTTKPTGKGTGLGLSISYDIITQTYNGSLVVDNDPNGGAFFTITLPVSNEMLTDEEKD